MKKAILLIILTLPHVSFTTKSLVGFWQLVEFSGEKGISETDKKMNEELSHGFYKGYIRFNKDSSFETAFYPNSAPTTPSHGKYKVQGNTLITLIKGKESKFQILKLSSDSLKVKLASNQINLFIKAKQN